MTELDRGEAVGGVLQPLLLAPGQAIQVGLVWVTRVELGLWARSSVTSRGWAVLAIASSSSVKSRVCLVTAQHRPEMGVGRAVRMVSSSSGVRPGPGEGAGLAECVDVA